VTRLGEFSHIGPLFAFGCFKKITKVAQIFVPLYSTVKVTYALILTKIGWADLFANFSQIHLVALFLNCL
jgi:hypothetical protein